jgi:hypothetical protein
MMTNLWGSVICNGIKAKCCSRGSRRSSEKANYKTSVTDLNGPFHPLTIESEKDSTVWKMCKIYIPSSLIIGSPFSFNCHRRPPRKCPMQFHISDGFSVRPAAATRVSLAWHFFLQILGGNYEMVNAHRPLSPERFYPVTVVFFSILSSTNRIGTVSYSVRQVTV